VAVAVTLAELGSVEQELGNAATAQTYLDQAVRIARRVPPEQAADAVPVFLDAGHSATDSGDARAALRHFEYADSVLRQSAHPDPSSQIETLFGLGNALRLLGELQRAEPAIVESLRLTERLFGPEHARLAGPLSALGNVQRQLGRYEPAAASLRRAISIMEREYVANDEGLLAARNNLALALGAAGDQRGEQAELSRLIALRQAGNGDQDLVLAGWYQNLGASLVRSGDNEAALEAVTTARQIYDERLPPGSARRAFPRLTSALVHLRRGDARAAARSADEAVAILEDSLPAGHYATAIGQCLLAEALIKLGDLRRGAQLADTALPIVERAPPEQADFIARCRLLHSGMAP
jgi:tetratricopeptide (TPR) repeat protein